MTRRVILGGGVSLSHTPKTKHRTLKGYAASRQAYDARRRRSKKTEMTKAFIAIVQQDPCCFCGVMPDLRKRNDADHIVPLNKGGLDTWENFTAACAPCNRGRRDTDLLTFLLRRGG